MTTLSDSVFWILCLNEPFIFFASLICSSGTILYARRWGSLPSLRLLDLSLSIFFTLIARYSGVMVRFLLDSDPPMALGTSLPSLSSLSSPSMSTSLSSSLALLPSLLFYFSSISLPFLPLNFCSSSLSSSSSKTSSSASSEESPSIALAFLSWAASRSPMRRGFLTRVARLS